MKFRTSLLIGLAIRLLMAPIFAHPFDVFSWYSYGLQFSTNLNEAWTFLVPYQFSYFFFVFPAALAFATLSTFIPSYSIPASSLDPNLIPRSPPGITIIPGMLFDFLVKLPLIASDAIIAWLLYRLLARQSPEGTSANAAVLIWFLNPLTIWVSSGWGMFDTLPTLFTIAGLYFAYGRKFVPSGICLAISAIMKFYSIVMVLPLLFIAAREGRQHTIKVTLATAIPLLLLFWARTTESASEVAAVALGQSAPGPHYSGLSFWTALSFFLPSADTSSVSSVAVVLALAISYWWLFRHRRNPSPTYPTIALVFPLLLLLLLYRFVGENFVVWSLPFLAILASQRRVSGKAFWTLSAIAFISSIIDSLLPYYLLPLSPWIGGYLLKILSAAAPYRVAPQGAVSAGVTVGRIVLSLLGICASFVIAFLSLSVGSAAAKASTQKPPRPPMRDSSDATSSRSISRSLE